MSLSVREGFTLQLDKIADRTIEEADGDNDGRISFEEFCRVGVLPYFLGPYSMSIVICIRWSITERVTRKVIMCNFTGDGKDGHRREDVDSIPQLNFSVIRSS